MVPTVIEIAPDKPPFAIKFLVRGEIDWQKAMFADGIPKLGKPFRGQVVTRLLAEFVDESSFIITVEQEACVPRLA